MWSIPQNEGLGFCEQTQSYPKGQGQASLDLRKFRKVLVPHLGKKPF
jgi:hypothetical protein